jgi:hypothetical protein
VSFIKIKTFININFSIIWKNPSLSMYKEDNMDF